MKWKIFVHLYYVVLLLLFVARLDYTSEPSAILRIFFMIAVLAPIFFFKWVSYPAIITLFYTLTIYGSAYSYMPYSISIYAATTVVMTIFTTIQDGKKLHHPSFLVFMVLYVITVDLVNSIGAEYFSLSSSTTIFCCFLIILLFFHHSSDHFSSIRQISLVFVIITMSLSLFFLINRGEFVTDYGYNTGLERYGWTDSNYFGMIIGMGVICSLLNLFDRTWTSIPVLEKAFFISGIFIALPTLILNASRGAILSVLAGIMVLLMFSKSRVYVKLLVSLAFFVSIFLLYKNKYFELLEYRVLNDVGIGSNRNFIWEDKLSAYADGSLMQILFGVGHDGGIRITGTVLAFHNDYLGFLVEYGLVGLLAFLLFLFYPIRMVYKSSKSNRAPVFTIMVFLAISCMTLEPFSMGILSFYSFYFMAILYSTIRQTAPTI